MSYSLEITRVFRTQYSPPSMGNTTRDHRLKFHGMEDKGSVASETKKGGMCQK